MEIIHAEVTGSSLRLVCAGSFGTGSLGNPSGQLMRRAIGEALSAPDWAALTEVVIDFTGVEYEWGDAAIASVIPAIRAGLHVTYLVNGINEGPLNDLLGRSSLRQWITIRREPAAPGE